MLKILYREMWSKDDPDYNMVRVELRRWTDEDHHLNDLVLDSTVVINGDDTSDIETVRSWYADCKAIRFAIGVFDGLLERHPEYKRRDES